MFASVLLSFIALSNMHDNTSTVTCYVLNDDECEFDTNSTAKYGKSITLFKIFLLQSKTKSFEFYAAI